MNGTNPHSAPLFITCEGNGYILTLGLCSLRAPICSLTPGEQWAGSVSGFCKGRVAVTLKQLARGRVAVTLKQLAPSCISWGSVASRGEVLHLVGKCCILRGSVASRGELLLLEYEHIR